MSTLLTASLLLAASLPCQQADTPRPKLIVMLAVDQMIPEQLDRLEPLLEGGLGRMLRGGTVFRDAQLPYARTETGAGHVTYSTGCLPRTHGVVGNAFWDRTLGREQYCVEDTEAAAIRGTGRVDGEGRRSPINLLRPTLAELVQRRDPATRVVSISAKDRAAIGMAGAARGLVLWWDKKGSGFESSSFYARELPSFVAEWNASWMERTRGWVWEDTTPYGDAPPARFGTAPDDRAGERPRGEAGVTFPYPFPDSVEPATLGGFAYGTPLADRFVFEVAGAATRHYELGERGATDVLLLSFSGCDVVGHSNGPYSREVTDLLIRIDRGLGQLFEHLDATLGAGGWVASLTADHGVLPLPEHLASTGYDARRVTKEELGAFRADLVARLSERLGGRVRHRMGPGGLQLDSKDLEAADVVPRAARAAAAEIVRELRRDHDWIAEAYSVDEIAAFGGEASGLRAPLAASFHADRTIDVVIVHRPGVLVASEKGTSHGSPHAYDRRVPLLFFGSPFPAEIRSDRVGSQDVVPSLLSALGFATDARFDGRVLFPRRSPK